jgi:hypothetical protein
MTHKEKLMSTFEDILIVGGNIKRFAENIPEFADEFQYLSHEMESVFRHLESIWGVCNWIEAYIVAAGKPNVIAKERLGFLKEYLDELIKNADTTAFSEEDNTFLIDAVVNLENVALKHRPK